MSLSLSQDWVLARNWQCQASVRNFRRRSAAFLSLPLPPRRSDGLRVVFLRGSGAASRRESNGPNRVARDGRGAARGGEARCAPGEHGNEHRGRSCAAAEISSETSTAHSTAQLCARGNRQRQSAGRCAARPRFGRASARAGAAVTGAAGWVGATDGGAGTSVGTGASIKFGTE